MDLSSKKTGDRLWAMLPVPTDVRHGDQENDCLAMESPFEVMYIDHTADFSGDGGAFIGTKAQCVVVSRRIVRSFDGNCLYDTRNEAIKQAIKQATDDAEKERDVFNAAIERYKKMLNVGDRKKLDIECPLCKSDDVKSVFVIRDNEGVSGAAERYKGKDFDCSCNSCNHRWGEYVASEKKYTKSSDAVFHRLWTLAVGSNGYDKEEWKELEQLVNLGIKANSSS